jgi:glycosyltransferase involved in cell wall biosynthesis
VAVDRHLASRQHAGTTDATGPIPDFDTSLICVNADLTASVAVTVPELFDRSYRIGMWYWEVEDFPASQHGGFAAVDEVWVATDFVRRAIEPHSPVPVRTVTPPLPQRGPEPTLTREDLGLPNRPTFLFVFDFLSTAERKNPLGLIDAFAEAFAPGEGPVLVIKSINADQRPSEAERLRLRAASVPDVLLMEDYLDAAERDALVALCDCYVSLHRSEGLGLTMAEAMAWGKPVIATGYSGNLQFMTEQNSYLVPWQPTQIPAGAEPYPAGGVWAEPDLHAAAALMRSVIDEPERAATRGARAAADIATRHTPEAAGRTVEAVLRESSGRRRRRSREAMARRLRSTVRRLVG